MSTISNLPRLSEGLEPQLTPEPTGEQVEEQWRLYWRTRTGGFWSDVSKSFAELALESWHAGEDVTMTFCMRCPEGRWSQHDHAATEEERGWALAEITAMRAMPVREAIG